MSETPHIRLQMRSNPLYLSGARELVAAVARRLAFSDEACGQIALAVDEALCNVIRHGYQRRPDGPIWISIVPIGGEDLCTDDRGSACCGRPATAIKVIIEDEARQVDPDGIRSRDLDEVRPGGLGVHIIRAVMDEVIYERRNDAGGAGMRLTMIKRRTAAGSSAGADERDMMGVPDEAERAAHG